MSKIIQDNIQLTLRRKRKATRFIIQTELAATAPVYVEIAVTEGHVGDDDQPYGPPEQRSYMRTPEQLVEDGVLASEDVTAIREILARAGDRVGDRLFESQLEA